MIENYLDTKAATDALIIQKQLVQPKVKIKSEMEFVNSFLGLGFWA
jgi:hypothetical protein